MCLWQRDMRSTRGRRKCAIQGEDRDEEVVQEGGEMVEGEEAGIEARTGDSDACFSQKGFPQKSSPQLVFGRESTVFDVNTMQY